MTAPYRIRNGTLIHFSDDWSGIVLDQSGPWVTVTLPDAIGVVPRSAIRKEGRRWVCH